MTKAMYLSVHPVRDLIVADDVEVDIASLLDGALAPTLAMGRHGSAQSVLQALSKALAGQEVDTLHLVAHGKPGAFLLGGHWIDAKALHAAAQWLALWRVRQVAVWSCHAGHDSDLMATFARITGATVHASSHALGCVNGAPRWQLERSAGTDRRSPPRAPFQPEVAAAWPHQLARMAFSGAVYQVTNTVDKESNSHTFNTTPLATSYVIDDMQSGRQFSGNDISVQLTFTSSSGPTTVYGWVSRPIKVGGQVVGFYLWSDADFTSLSAAQVDGNADGDSADGPADPGTADNFGYILVIPGRESNFASGTINSSSDRVDSSLNAFVPANAAPTPVNDTNTATEDGSATGNVLSNDTDPNSDTLTVTGYTIAGITGTQSTGGTVSITGVGTISIQSSGAYTFTPAANYFGPVPLISYTVADPSGATATATLSLTVSSGNDAPAATGESRTVTEDTPVTGNVLSNDTDGDGDTLTVSTYSIAGQAGPFAVGTPYAISGVGTFTLSSNGSYTFAPAANYAGSVPVITYTASDGRGGTSQADLTLTMAAVNDAPAAAADNTDGALFARAEDCAPGTQATPQTGNVLSNDSDPDVTLAAGTTHVVTGVRSESGAGSTWNGSSVTTVIGRYGTLTINPDGSYSYAIDGNNTAVQALTSSQELTETFSYTMSEAAGAQPLTSSSTIRIVVKGNNDAPLARDDLDSISEAGSSTTTNSIVHFGTVSAAASGVLANDRDPESGSLTISGTTVSGAATATYQAGTTTATLSFTFAQTPAQLKENYFIYYLNSGVSDTTPQLLYRDAALTTALRPATVTGTGSSTNITLDVTTVYYRDGTTTVSRSLSAGDTLGLDDVSSSPSGSDYYQATIQSFTTTSTARFNSVTGSSGTLASGSTVSFSSGSTTFVGTVGALTYDANGAVTSFALTAADGNLVNGTAYNLSFATSVASGVMLNGQYGRLSLASDGSYTYYLTSNALAPGQQYTERFTYTVTDGQCTDTGVLSILVTGTQVSLSDTTAAGPEDNPITGSVQVGGSTVASATWYGAALTLGGSGTTVDGVGTLVLNTNGTFTFTPASNYSGPVESLTYSTSAGSVATLSLSITARNDAPEGTDKTVSITDKQTYTFSAADFGFSDPNDSPSNALSQVKITSLPGSGTLKLGANTVTAGASIPVASLGTLTYTPARNTGANQTVNFTFQVQDNGGTSNSGVDLDASANSFTFSVDRVNDAPVNTLPTAPTTNSYSALSFSGANAISVSDPDGNEHRCGCVPRHWWHSCGDCRCWRHGDGGRHRYVDSGPHRDAGRNASGRRHAGLHAAVDLCRQ